MKKIFPFVLSLALLACLTLAGCSQEEEGLAKVTLNPVQTI